MPDFRNTIKQNGVDVSLVGHTHAGQTPAAYTDIPDAADLNSYTTPGFYRQVGNAYAANGSNYPVPLAGSLIVLANAGYTQIYATYKSSDPYPRVYVRSYYLGNWSTWRRLISDYDIALPDWISATLINGWINYSGTTTAYYKDVLGVVRIKGVVRGGTDQIFQLPAGYRPIQEVAFIQPNVVTGWEFTSKLVLVQTNGYVNTTSASGNLHIDISFRAEQ